MMWFIVGALIGLLVSAWILLKSTRGRRMEVFEWWMLLLTVLVGAIFVGGFLVVAERILSL